MNKIANSKKERGYTLAAIMLVGALVFVIAYIVIKPFRLVAFILSLLVAVFSAMYMIWALKDSD